MSLKREDWRIFKTLPSPGPHVSVKYQESIEPSVTYKTQPNDFFLSSRSRSLAGRANKHFCSTLIPKNTQAIPTQFKIGTQVFGR